MHPHPERRHINTRIIVMTVFAVLVTGIVVGSALFADKVDRIIEPSHRTAPAR